MKKIAFLFAIAFGLGFLVSCETENNNPVLDTTQIVAPSITSDFDSLVLIQDSVGAAINFTWSAANYGIENIEPVNYSFQMRPADSTEWINLVSTTETMYQTTVGAFNQKLLGLLLPTNEPLDIVFRVMAFINTDSDVTNAYSSDKTIVITAYEEELNIKPIYILGDGTPAGWDNTAALEMTPQPGGSFTITVFLDPGAGSYMKFISVLGQWAPQWGTDATGTPEAGPLVYRPTEDVTDPAAIPIPDIAGDYVVVADTANLTYSTTPATKSMELLNGQTIEMSKTGLSQFTVTTELIDGTLQFAETGGTNSVWSVEKTEGLEGNIHWNVNNKKMFDFEEGRRYEVNVDLSSRTFSVYPK